MILHRQFPIIDARLIIDHDLFIFQPPLTALMTIPLLFKRYLRNNIIPIDNACLIDILEYELELIRPITIDHFRLPECNQIDLPLVLHRVLYHIIREQQSQRTAQRMPANEVFQRHIRTAVDLAQLVHDLPVQLRGPVHEAVVELNVVEAVLVDHHALQVGLHIRVEVAVQRAIRAPEGDLALLLGLVQPHLAEQVLVRDVDALGVIFGEDVVEIKFFAEVQVHFRVVEFFLSFGPVLYFLADEREFEDEAEALLDLASLGDLLRHDSFELFEECEIRVCPDFYI